MSKLNILLQIKNEKSKTEVKKRTPFMMLSKRIKYLAMNLPK